MRGDRLREAEVRKGGCALDEEAAENGVEAAERRRGRKPAKKRSRAGESNDEKEESGENGEDDDEEDANADLSLRIVAKAERRQKKKKAEAARVRCGEEGDVRAEIRVLEDEGMEDAREAISAGEGGAEARGDTPEEGELREDEDGITLLGMEMGNVVEDKDGNPLLGMELGNMAEEDGHGEGEGGESKRSKKKRKKERREKKEKKRRGDAAAEAEEDEEVQGAATLGGGESAAAEVKDAQAEESLVMRKLLRGPRYFDPPEEQGELCFNCGALGHFAAACSEAPRLRPCYVCGGFGHDGRECPQKTECYVCGRVGHIAKNCPNKGAARPSARDGGESVCLLCGRGGHEAAACWHSYDERDLEQVQCYLCRGFGHLCCAVVVDGSPYPVSCFDCGEMGHTGGSCARSRRGDRGAPSVCYKCGEEGHYARGCSRRSLDWPPGEGGGERRPPSPVNDRFLPGEGGRGPRWMDIQQREPRWGHQRGDRWKGSSRFTFDAPVDDGEEDGYMGPIDRFATVPNDSFRKRRKDSWKSTPGRSRG